MNKIYEFELLILATFPNFGSRIFKFKILKILLKTVRQMRQEIEILINKLAEITISTDLHKG